MSKIEEYKKAKETAELLAKNVDCALGRDRKDNDKHIAQITYSNCDQGQWNDILFYFHAIYGYYGNSSGYSATSEAMGKYLAKAINIKIKSLLDDAVRFAKEDAEEARLAAIAEAESVLKETK